MSWILPAARKRPSSLGLNEGQLRACPSSPNCVSSQATVDSQKVPPISYIGSPLRAKLGLMSILNEDSKATIITETDNYLHVEYRAFVFIDDVEFYFPKDEPVIHVRSASRVGHSDMGANKRRVLAISTAFSSQQ
ncbi:MAG: DUF1499 domain-containing protein [Saprospiraceae bacterium]